MSKETIGRGLDARQRQKSGGPIPLSDLFGAPASVSQLNDLANKITSKRDRLKALSEVVRKAIASSRAEIEARYADFGKVRDGNHVTDTIGDNRRRAAIEREVTKFARTARKTSDADRSKLLAEVRDIAAKIKSVRDAWANPVTILDRRTLANSKRAVYAQNLAGANVTALTHALRDAVSSGNASLAMAALMAAEKLPKETRKLLPYSAADVAGAIPEVRDEMAKAGQFISLTELAAAESELAQAQAEGARDTSTLLMRVGRLRDEHTALTGGDAEAEETGDGNRLSTDDWEKALDAKFPAVPAPDNVTVIGRGQ